MSLTTGFCQLKRELVLKGITYTALARKMGISQQALSRKLNGSIAWSLKDVLIVGDALELPGDELLALFPRDLL